MHLVQRPSTRTHCTERQLRWGWDDMVIVDCNCLHSPRSGLSRSVAAVDAADPADAATAVDGGCRKTKARLPPTWPGKRIPPPGPPPDGLSLRVGPNPLGDDSAVRIETDRFREIRVDLVDLLGRRVRTLFQGAVEAGGRHAVAVRPGGLPSGIYVVRVTATGAAASARVVVAR